MSRTLGELEYEIYVLASVAQIATEAIVLSAKMDYEQSAIDHLRGQRETIKLILTMKRSGEGRQNGQDR